MVRLIALRMNSEETLHSGGAKQGIRKQQVEGRDRIVILGKFKASLPESEN